MDGDLGDLLVDEVVRRQGVEPVSDISELAGQRIDDFEDFLEAVWAVRGH